MCTCVCMCVCVRACVHACVCVRVCNLCICPLLVCRYTCFTLCVFYVMHSLVFVCCVGSM